MKPWKAWLAISASSAMVVSVVAPLRLSVASPGAPTGTQVLKIDAGAPIRAISPLIRGISGDGEPSYMRDAGITVNSWGGNPSTRYNYNIGHAWNSASDWEYRNGNYGTTGDVAGQFVSQAAATGVKVRLAVPTLGWVAKDDRSDTCSFPQAGGGCGGGAGVNCTSNGRRADPTTANVASTPAGVKAWVVRLLADHPGGIDYVAMDNEPELWGYTQYDVHPTCTTYEEILNRYTTYADALRNVAPDARFTGPVMCCWYSFWNAAPGPATGPKVDFLTWFLQQMKSHDTSAGRRTLDLLDVHYYPQSDVYNDKVDASSNARRLRSTRSLFDPKYTDESWIKSTIRLIPRLRETIARTYPGTGLAISEWNFGADTTMNGALAIADVLGIYGREGVDVAAYWRSPKQLSPGYFAFKMYGNYDDKGSSFSGTAVRVVAPDIDRVSSYAAVDSRSGKLKVMIVNKDPSNAQTVSMSLTRFRSAPTVTTYQYSAAHKGIVRTTVPLSSLTQGISMPASTVTLVEFAAAAGAA